MNLNEIDYGTIGEDELYKEILLNSGVNDFFINTPYTYEVLKGNLEYTMSQNGLEKIISEEDANRLLSSIQEDWTIRDDEVISQAQVRIGDNNLYATNVQQYRANKLKRLSDNKIANNSLLYTMQSEFAPEAQKLGFEDMPQILANDNRIVETSTENLIDISEDGTATQLSTTTRDKISTLAREEFAELQQNIQNKDWEEALNLPDEHYTRVNKTTINSDISNLEDLEVEPEEIEHRQYTDEEYAQMAQRVMSNSSTQVIEIQKGDTLSELAQKYGTTVDNLAKMNNIQNPDLIYAGNSLTIPAQREEVIKQALLELGLSETMYDGFKYDVDKIVNKSIQNNDQIGNLTNQEQVEQLIRQFNKDIVLKDEYILGKVDADKKQEKNAEALTPSEEAIPEEYDRNNVIEIYRDKDDGTYHRSSISAGANEYGIYTDVFEENYRFTDENTWEQLTNSYKKSDIELTPETYAKYEQSNLKNMDLSTALGIKNKPNEEWESITTTTSMPDVCIESRREEGRRLQEEKSAAVPNKENEITIEVANGIDSTGDNSNQHTEEFEEANGEITEAELAEAAETILSRNNATENGTISVMVGNSKKITISVEPYIQGDAESENARAANEEERSRQTQPTQTEDLTK